MIEGVSAAVWVNSGGILLAVIVILAILRGYLVPKSTLDAVRQDYDERAAELKSLTEERIQSWKDLYETQRQATDTTAEAIDEVLFVGKELSRGNELVLRVIQDMRKEQQQRGIGA